MIRDKIMNLGQLRKSIQLMFLFNVLQLPGYCSTFFGNFSSGISTENFESNQDQDFEQGHLEVKFISSVLCHILSRYISISVDKSQATSMLLTDFGDRKNDRSFELLRTYSLKE